MLDLFLILTPLLLLAIVALLGFTGCYTPVMLTPPPPPPPGVTHVKTVVNSNGANTNTITSDMLTLQGGEFIVVAVQWGSANAAPGMPQLSETSMASIKFPGVSNGGPFVWYALDSNHSMMVQIFSASNPMGNTQFTVKASLLQASTVPWNLCVSAYDGVNESTPLSSPQSSSLPGDNPHTSPISFGTGALVYAVAFAADSSGLFPSGNMLTAGAGFTPESPQPGNPLVEDGNATNPLTAQVNNSNTDPNAKGFIFAMVLNSES